MLQSSPEWTVFAINSAAALCAAFLIDFIVAYWLIQSGRLTTKEKRDEKPERPFLWSIGILPGVLIFVFFNLVFLLDMIDKGLRYGLILLFAILLIIASFSGGALASYTVKQKFHEKFELVLED